MNDSSEPTATAKVAGQFCFETCAGCAASL